MGRKVKDFLHGSSRREIRLQTQNKEFPINNTCLFYVDLKQKLAYKNPVIQNLTAEILKLDPHYHIRTYSAWK